MSAKICVIGTGRVGLPLALAFSMKGAEVIGVEVDKNIVEKVKNKKMPFLEPFFDEIISSYNLKIFLEDYSVIEGYDHVIITVGTPLRKNIETDLSHIDKVINNVIPFLRKGHNIILRSTVSPGTTKFLKDKIEQSTSLRIGKDIGLSFCPERILEGKAFEELFNLPQIIGSEDELSRSLAERVFKLLGVETLHTNYITAELVKLFNNTSRYIYFAVANFFTMLANKWDVDFYEILHFANYNYPRPIVGKPGLTAGACLRKDFGMLAEHIIESGSILTEAWRINESMPKFLAEETDRRWGLKGKIVTVLGYTFKADTDDVRDSLVPKLIRYIYRKLPYKIFVHDPYIKDIGPLKDELGSLLEYNLSLIDNNSLLSVLRDTDIVFIATNHKYYETNSQALLSNMKPDTCVADVWNIFKRNKIFWRV